MNKTRKDIKALGIDEDELLSMELDKDNRMMTSILYTLYIFSCLPLRKRLSLIFELLLGRRFFVYRASKEKEGKSWIKNIYL